MKASIEIQKSHRFESRFFTSPYLYGIVYIQFHGVLYIRPMRHFNKALADACMMYTAAALYNMGWSYYRKGDCETALLKYDGP